MDLIIAGLPFSNRDSHGTLGDHPLSRFHPLEVGFPSFEAPFGMVKAKCCLTRRGN